LGNPANEPTLIDVLIDEDFGADDPRLIPGCGRGGRIAEDPEWASRLTGPIRRGGPAKMPKLSGVPPPAAP